jgi:predicted peroxiredoxin
MKKLFLALMVIGSMMVLSADSTKKDSLFVNVTTSQNIKAPMALMFAMKGLERGHDMTILLNAQGVQLAIETFESPVNARNGKTSQEMLAMFMKKGGKVLVCPMCLEAMGYTKANLIKGAEVSSADSTFGAILSSSKVISY